MRKLANEELNRKSINEFRESPKIPFVVVLDNVRSLNNIGSVFRTADAFLIESVFLCGITGTPPHREINKTALGATESVSWKYFSETAGAVRSLKEEGYVVVSVEQAEGSVSLTDFIPLKDHKYALVFGHEINGVAQEGDRSLRFMLRDPAIRHQALFQYCGKRWNSVMGSVRKNLNQIKKSPDPPAGGSGL